MICTYISPPVDSFVDEGVYPPHVEDVGSDSGSAEADVEKGGVKVAEKYT